MNYRIYTDGAASPNPGKGGWGYVIIDDSDYEVHYDSGYVPNTTNQRMELIACIEGCKSALQFGKEDSFIADTYTIYTDSAYLCQCVNDKWYTKWENNGWRNSKKEPVANKDLWEQLIPFFNDWRFNWKKIKGHQADSSSDTYYNNIADQLAVSARSEI